MRKVTTCKYGAREITIVEFCMAEVAINESGMGKIDAAEFATLDMNAYECCVAECLVSYLALFRSDPPNFGSYFL